MEKFETLATTLLWRGWQPLTPSRTFSGLKLTENVPYLGFENCAFYQVVH